LAGRAADALPPEKTPNPGNDRKDRMACGDSSGIVEPEQARTDLPLEGQQEESPVAVRRIPTGEVLSQFLGRLDLAQDQYLIEAGGKPIAGLVPP